jgi:hypothetical protein
VVERSGNGFFDVQLQGKGQQTVKLRGTQLSLLGGKRKADGAARPGNHFP